MTMSSRLVIGQVASDFGFDCREIRRVGLRIERRHRDPGLLIPLSADFDARIARQPASRIRSASRISAWRSAMKRSASRGRLQRLVIRNALGLEVGRKIVVRVAVAVGADHPDLLAAQLVAQGLQDADLVGDPVDALASLGVLFEDRFSPETAHDVVDRNHFLGGESLKFRIGVTLQEIERLDDWAMALVVRAKFQASEGFRGPCGGNGPCRNCGSPFAAWSDSSGP